MRRGKMKELIFSGNINGNISPIVYALLMGSARFYEIEIISKGGKTLNLRKNSFFPKRTKIIKSLQKVISSVRIVFTDSDIASHEIMARKEMIFSNSFLPRNRLENASLEVMKYF